MLNWRAAARNEHRRRKQAEARIVLLETWLRAEGRPVDWRWGNGWGSEAERTEA